MRRQTKPQGLAARWPARPLDIDPFRLPARFSLPVRTISGRILRARDRIEIDPTIIAVEREVMGHRSVRQTVGLQDFSGVAIRAELIGENEDRFAMSVNLHHDDPELCIPLHVSFDMSDVNARWQSWGRALGLPLLLPALDGSWQEPVQRLGKLEVNPPLARAARLRLSGRKSCMSSIRETGHGGDMPVRGGAEIIARN